MSSNSRGNQSLLIIAPHGSYRTMAYVQAAERMGIRAVIASEGKNSIISAYVKGIHINFSDSQQAYSDLLDAARDFNVAAVIGTDDSTLELASRLSQQLKLPHNDPQSVRIASRKDLARDRLLIAGVPKPEHRCIDLGNALEPQIIDLEFPVVVKPVALSASQGVIRANNKDELLRAIDRIENIVEQNTYADDETRHTLLIEQFISGDEVAVEAILSRGELEILTIFDKPDALNGPFFEETYYTTPTQLGNKKIEELKRIIVQACAAYGLKEGPVHAECRINESGIYMLEVAARTIGGLCGRLLRFGTGYSLEELVLSHAINKPLAGATQTGAAGVLMIPIPAAGVFKRVEGLLAAQNVPFIEEVSIQVREGYELVPLPEGSSYLGFIFSRAPDVIQAEQALRDAHACLKFVISPLWKIEKGKIEKGKIEQNTSCVA